MLFINDNPAFTRQLAIRGETDRIWYVNLVVRYLNRHAILLLVIKPTTIFQAPLINTDMIFQLTLDLIVENIMH